MPDEFIQILTTTATQDNARQIASALVEQRLAACVQIVGPIESIYRWSGKTETAVEWQCQIKTRRDLFEPVEQAIRQLHKYDVPEIIALPIIVGSELYLRWLRIETADWLLNYLQAKRNAFRLISRRAASPRFNTFSTPTRRAL